VFCLNCKKKEPEPLVVAWLNDHNENSLYLSVITIGEIEKGIAKLSDASEKKEILGNWLANELLTRFSERILAIETNVVRCWGNILGENERNGIIVPAIDALIGATAIVNECILVTRNDKDFEYVQCKVLNIWK
jgi:predicted nucleic acid-binding protein